MKVITSRLRPKIVKSKNEKRLERRRDVETRFYRLCNENAGGDTNMIFDGKKARGLSSACLSVAG